MFKFGFAAPDDVDEENADDETSTKEASLTWFPAKKIEISTAQLSQKLDEDDFKESDLFHDVKLKLIHTDKVAIDLQYENNENILEAESQHSDLLPAKYEGGLKVWECSYDLGKYLIGENIQLKNKSVLDLGCGAGMIGLLALLRGSSNVDFQDYNAEVIRSVTIPNVILNVSDKKLAQENCGFFSGDWGSFLKLSDDPLKKYDLILTSETIYNPENHKKLYDIFKRKLKNDGAVYVAAKIYYFGVGGGIRQFEELVKKEKLFESQTVWRSEEGVQREILKLSFTGDYRIEDEKGMIKR